jgi:hypothetical protein
VTRSTNHLARGNATPAIEVTNSTKYTHAEWQDLPLKDGITAYQNGDAGTNQQKVILSIIRP